MSKKIDFFDGVESATAPTEGTIAVASLQSYANDAAYETANGPGQPNNIYFNTTLNKIRYYGTSWTTIEVDGDYLTVLTGDVTSTGAPSAATTIANDVVSNAKLANVPTSTFKGRTTAGTGDPEDLTVSQAKTLLNLTGTNSGDQTITLTGDVNGTGTGSFVTAITADSVTNGKLDNVPTQTFKGRTTAGTGDPEDLTATQATAILNPFVGDSGSGGTKGLVPAPVTGDATKFLRGDGTFQTVAAGANTTLSNLVAPTSIPVNLLPDSNNTRSVGSASLAFAAVYSNIIQGNTGEMLIWPGLNSGNDILVISGTSNSSANVGNFRLGVGDQTSSGTGTIGSMLIQGGDIFNAANSNNSGGMTVRSGNTAGAGDSGDLLLEIGTVTSGTRGKLKIQDGSEGTAGHVWTSTGTGGEGAWAALAGSTLANDTFFNARNAADSADIPLFKLTAADEFTLVDSAGLLSINVHDRIGYDGVEERAIDWGGNRILYDVDGSISVAWDGRVIRTSDGTIAMNWETRDLFDDTLNESVKWQQRQLKKSDSGTSIDWETRALYANDGVSIDYAGRTLQDNTANVFLAWENGKFNVQGTETTAGTTGDQTIDKISGTVNFAAAATSLVVTNNKVTTSSIVLAVVRTNDATLKSVQVVPTSGSFTIYANAAATAETSVGFFVVQIF